MHAACAVVAFICDPASSIAENAASKPRRISTDVLLFQQADIEGCQAAGNSAMIAQSRSGEN
jgi:hypothetical protein